MTLYATVVAITILAAVVNLACSWVVWARLRKANTGKTPGWWTPAQVRAVESCKPGDTILLTTDQYFNFTQRAFIREWAEEIKAKTGVWLVVLEGGIKLAAALSTDAGQAAQAAASAHARRTADSLRTAPPPTEPAPLGCNPLGNPHAQGPITAVRYSSPADHKSPP